MHVVGVGEQWGRELPGLVGSGGKGAEQDSGVVVNQEKMKIAWRYERLGEFGAGGAGSRGGMPYLRCLVMYIYSKESFLSFRKSSFVSENIGANMHSSSLH